MAEVMRGWDGEGTRESVQPLQLSSITETPIHWRVTTVD